MSRCFTPTSAARAASSMAAMKSPGYWDPWGFTSPGAAHALMFRRHMELYGTTTRQLAEVSVAFRDHARLNPEAVMKAPMTIDDHEALALIVAPLRLLDYCLINDGAVCLILTTKERAADLASRPCWSAVSADGTPFAQPRSKTSSSISGTTRSAASGRTMPSRWPMSTARMSTL